MEQPANTAAVLLRSATTSSCKNANASPLLQLPAELRNAIYQLALVDEEGVDIEPAAFLNKIALTQTCSDIRGETLSMFYAINTFRIKPSRDNHDSTLAWLSNLSVEVRLIKRIAFEHLSQTKWKTAQAAGTEPRGKADLPFVVDLNRVAVENAVRLIGGLEIAVAAGLDLDALEVSPPADGEIFGVYTSVVCSWIGHWCQVIKRQARP